MLAGFAEAALNGFAAAPLRKAFSALVWRGFEIVVEAPIEFVGEASASFNFVFSIKSSLNPTIKVDLRTWHKNFVARSGAGNKIVKVEYNLKYTYSNRNFEHNFSDK